MTLKRLALVPLMMVLGLSVASARRGDHGRHGDRGPKMHALMKELKLTAEQKEKIKAEREKRKSDMKATREKSKAAREKLREAFQQNASADQLRALKNEVQAAHMALANARFEGMLAIREVLTPEQRTKFNEWHQKHQERMGPPDEDDGDDD